MAARAFEYQKDGVRDMEDFLRMGRGVLLADDMGLGKTLEVLWCLRRQKVRKMFPALVVCPANVKYGWEHMALEHTNLRAQVLEGRTPTNGGLVTAQRPKLTVINPDILPSWLSHLREVGYRTLILDECQYFGNPAAKRTKAAIDLSRNVASVMALSGTPLLNNPGELWPSLYMVRPDRFRSLFAFAEEFCRPKREFGRWTYKGARNLDRLHALLRRTCMVRRLKEDVLDDLPDKVRVVVPMDLSDRFEYNHAATDFVGWLRKHYRDNRGRVQRAARAIAVTRVGYLVRLAAKLKARSVVEWANRFLEERPTDKLVLFGVHRKMLRVLERRVHAKHVTVDGSVVGRRRKLAVDQFRKDPATRLFIGNVRAAGVGVDGLQEACQNLAFAELWWVPGVHTQAEDRIYRIGQRGVAWINYLVAGGTIEEHLCRIIQEKQRTIHATLDGADYDGDMDVFDRLIAALEDRHD